MIFIRCSPANEDSKKHNFCHRLQSWFPRFESNKYLAIKVKQIFSTPLLRRPQEPQGCQKIHKNISKIDLMSYWAKLQPKLEIMSKNLKNNQKLMFFLVYTLIRAKPFFDIDITSAHNPTDQETVEFLSRNYQV